MQSKSLVARIEPALPRVLLVDGHDDSREMYRSAFSIGGWSVEEARDGRDALVKALASPPAVVVTELRLRFISGFDLCVILGNDPKTAMVPIVVVTAETRAAELAKAERVGAKTVRVKPCLPDEILVEMQRLVHLSTPPTTALAPPSPPEEGHRIPLVKAHLRTMTSTPAVAPIDLCCPVCARPLCYQKTYSGGVSRLHPERWDYYKCADCGDFQYRYRTRKLRAI